MAFTVEYNHIALRKKRLRPLFVLFVIQTAAVVVVLPVDGQTDETVRFQIQEQIPPGTRIGNLINESGLRKKYSKDVVSQLEFRFLTEPPIAVVIGASDSVIRTRGYIDRDTMPGCRQRDTCEVNLDVTVQPVQYFRIIKVRLSLHPSTSSSSLSPSLSPSLSVSVFVSVSVSVFVSVNVK